MKQVTLLIFLISSALTAADYVPGMIVVRLKPTSRISVAGSALEDLKTHFGASSYSPAKVIPKKGFSVASAKNTTYVFNFEPSANIESKAAEIQSTGQVEFAEPNYLLKPLALPFYGKQPQIDQTDLKYANYIPVSHNIVVAVIDSGIDLNHKDLKNKVLSGKSFFANGGNFPDSDDFTDTFWHGTFVAGLIAGENRDGTGISGINPAAKLLVVRIIDYKGRANQLDASNAIVYAVNSGAQIINLSLSNTAMNTALKEAIDYALKNNVMIFAAVGNDSNATVEYPAAYPGVIAVGSISTANIRSSFSNTGDHVQFVSYGEKIYSAGGAGYIVANGTSFSTPIVAAIASRIWAQKPSRTSAEVLKIMQDSTIDLGPSGRDSEYGYGLISIAKAARAMDIAPIKETIANYPATPFSIFKVHIRLDRELTDSGETIIVPAIQSETPY